MIDGFKIYNWPFLFHSVYLTSVVCARNGYISRALHYFGQFIACRWGPFVQLEMHQTQLQINKWIGWQEFGKTEGSNRNVPDQM